MSLDLREVIARRQVDHALEGTVKFSLRHGEECVSIRKSVRVRLPYSAENIIPLRRIRSPVHREGNALTVRAGRPQTDHMRALSIRQPLAGLIAAGIKDVENRSRHTSHRGPLLIYASRRRARRTLVEIASEYRVTVTDELARLCARSGGIIGMVNVVDCAPVSPSEWFDGPLDSNGKRNWGYVLRDARVLPFRSALGRLGIFDVPDAMYPGRTPCSNHQC